MPFCTTCGKEVTSGNKFCEYCGAPLDQPAAPPSVPVPGAAPPGTPVAQPVITQPAAGGSGKGRLVAGILIVLLVLAGIYFVGLPMISGSSGSHAPAKAKTAGPTQVPAAAVTTETSVPVTPENTVPAQTYEEKYTETYNQVYTTSHAFKGGQREIFTQNLVSPPLYVKYNITPTIEIGEKLDEYGNMVNTSYVSPSSWFKVSVYDAGNGNLVEEQGFNKGYSTATSQELMVRAPGNYRVEMAGNDVTADVRILTGKS